MGKVLKVRRVGYESDFFSVLYPDIVVVEIFDLGHIANDDIIDQDALRLEDGELYDDSLTWSTFNTR